MGREITEGQQLSSGTVEADLWAGLETGSTWNRNQGKRSQPGQKIGLFTKFISGLNHPPSTAGTRRLQAS